jgi:hypothetical protein
MIVHDFNVMRTTVFPSKTDPPLVIGAFGGGCVRRSVRLYEEIVDQTHVITDPVAFGRIDDAKLRRKRKNPPVTAEGRRTHLPLFFFSASAKA